jgi:alanyl-tRNA synthetase
VGAVRRAAERLENLERSVAEARAKRAQADIEELERESEEIDGVRIVVAPGQGADQRALLDLADRVRARLGEAAVVIGGAEDGRVGIVAAFSGKAIDRGLSAAAVVREAAEVVSGGGGGRDDVAQAGGKDPSRLEEALQVAREAIRRGLSS